MRRLALLMLMSLILTACATTTPVPPAARGELAPTGKLRAGISFSNVLLTTLGPNGEQGGVAVELARELARRLDVPLEIIPYKSAGQAADAARTGAWDISVLGIEAQRAKETAFATPLTDIEATLEYAEKLPGSRILEGNFSVIRHTVGTPNGRDA